MGADEARRAAAESWARRQREDGVRLFAGVMAVGVFALFCAVADPLIATEAQGRWLTIAACCLVGPGSYIALVVLLGRILQC